MSNRIIFSKADLLKITELLQEQSLSEVSRQFGLTDLKLLYEKKYNTDLAEAIQKRIRGSLPESAENYVKDFL